MKTKEECGTWHGRQFLVLMGSFNKTWFLQETRILLSLLQGWYIIFMLFVKKKWWQTYVHTYVHYKKVVHFSYYITLFIKMRTMDSRHYLHQFIWWVRHHIIRHLVMKFKNNVSNRHIWSRPPGTRHKLHTIKCIRIQVAKVKENVKVRTVQYYLKPFHCIPKSGGTNQKYSPSKCTQKAVMMLCVKCVQCKQRSLNSWTAAVNVFLLCPSFSPSSRQLR